MRDQDDVGALHPVAKRGGAFAAKPVVADLRHLIDQVHLELDRKTGAKGEPCAHPLGIGVDRHVEVAAQFGEILDIADRVPYAGAVNPRDKCHVLAARQCGIMHQTHPR